MQPTQNPQDYNQPNPPTAGQPYAPQPVQQPTVSQPAPEGPTPLQQPYGQQYNNPPANYSPIQPTQSAYAQAQQTGYAPQPGGQAPPLRPYSPQFNQPEPVEENPYDFFLNPDDKKKKVPKLATSGSGLGLGKILMVAGAVFGVLGIAAILLTSSGGGTDQAPALTAIAKDQQEIIHVTTAASTILEAESLQNFAVTARYSTTSAQAQYVDFLNKNGVGIKAKDLEAATFPETDKVLTAAQTASTYDSTFKSTMQTVLTDYLARLRQVRAASPTQAQSDILDKNISSATLLQQQLGT